MDEVSVRGDQAQAESRCGYFWSTAASAVTADVVMRRFSTCVLAFTVALLTLNAAVPTQATDVTIQGLDYITSAVNLVNTTSLAAGQLYVIELLITDVATNATIGNWLGYCVALRSDGLSQCQYTVQLAEGTLQVSSKMFCRYGAKQCGVQGRLRGELTVCRRPVCSPTNLDHPSTPFLMGCNPLLEVCA